MNVGFMFGYNDFHIADFDKDRINEYLSDDKFFSINMNNYYIFILKALDTTDERYSYALINLNNQLLSSNNDTMCNESSPRIINKGGRPSFGSVEDFEDILHDWFHCKIGTKEAKNLMNLKQGNKSTWIRLQKGYKAKYGIEDNRNNIDILNSKGYNNALKIGYIKYKGQDIKYFYNNKSTL